jgi:hypothetical protein
MLVNKAEEEMMVQIVQKTKDMSLKDFGIIFIFTKEN